MVLAAALHCLLELGLAGAHSYVRADLSKLTPGHSLSGIRVLLWLKTDQMGICVQTEYLHWSIQEDDLQVTGVCLCQLFSYAHGVPLVSRGGQYHTFYKNPFLLPAVSDCPPF